MKSTIRILGISAVAGVLAALIGGCLPFPLGDPAKSQVDPKLAGFWMSQSDDEREVIAMWPFDEHTYLVQDVKLKKEDDKWQPQGPASLYKGWLSPIKDARFLTLDPLPQHLPNQSSEQKVYPAMRITLNGDIVTARRVNEDADLIKAVKNAAELEAVITKELNNADIYSGEGTKFKRLDPEKDTEIVQSVYKQ